MWWWPFKRRYSPPMRAGRAGVAVKVPATVLKTVHDAALKDLDACRRGREACDAKAIGLSELCRERQKVIADLDGQVQTLTLTNDRLKARVAELESYHGPEQRYIQALETAKTQYENERANRTPRVENKQTEPLPANDRNMSVFDTTNWEVTPTEHRRDETTSHPHSPTGDDSPPVPSIMKDILSEQRGDGQC